MARLSSSFLARLLLSATGVLASLTVDVNDAASVRKAAAVVAGDLMGFYKGEIFGLLPGPPPDGDYYWWTGGALWATMLDYRSRTGDTQYDDKISQGLLWQTGPNNNFMPPNWTATEANDDQAIWAMAALVAVETGFTEAGEDNPKWLNLAQNVFDDQSDAARRVEGDCKDALRWQILPINNGYDYVSTIANVAYVNVGARLSVLQGNKTQAATVTKAVNNLHSMGLIDGDWNVYDGAHAPDCSDVNHLQSSYTAALALEAAAVMWNSTGADAWKTILDGLTARTIKIFFPNGVAKEVSCEPMTCNTDMTFFKSFLHRSLASTMKVAPYTADHILPALKTSAAAAAKTCTSGANNRLCGSVWSVTSDGVTGAGSQMSVLSALLSLLPVVDVADNGPQSTTSPTTSPTGSSPSATTTPPSSSSARAGISALALLASLAFTSLLLG